MTTRKKSARKKASSKLQLASAEKPSPVLELVLTRFRLLAMQRLGWLEKLWSEEGAPSAKAGISRDEIEGHLADRDSPESESAWLQGGESSRRYRASLAGIEKAIAADQSSRLARLVNVFGLSTEESDLLQACVAVALDPALARVCAYLQDHTGRAYVTEDLAARLFGYGRSGIWSPESPLFRWELVSTKDIGPGEPRALACDPYIRDWLAERHTVDESLVGIGRVQEPKSPLRSWPVDESVEFINRTIYAESADRLRFVITGARGSGRRTLAVTIAATAGLPLLVIDADRVDDQTWPRVFLRAQRQAYLERRAVAWMGESLARRLWPEVPFFPLQFVLCEAGHEPPPISDLIERNLKMPGLVIAEREHLWREHIPGAKKWPKEDLVFLAQSYRVHVGDIADAARSRVVNSEEAIKRVRVSARSRLGNLAQLLECPFDWDDLVVPDVLKETLKDIVFEARARGAFWEEENNRRTFPQGRGLMALMSGPPGTGKTMAAQVIAASLQHDLFRIDLSSIVSKYVGETSQNLERILSRAAEIDAVLLFDEADALFSKRVTEVRDAQDKFANTDAAYLLQAIESFPGIAILATNQKNNIDPAFIRRLRFVIDFEKPNVAQRLEIWTKVTERLTGTERVEAMREDLRSLAESVEATGAQIKFAVLGAIFIAKRAGKILSITHVLRGLERELAKEGRALGSRDRKRMLVDGE
ncbi:MAG: ATP-binding protein [Verrucomicrobiota bacterium]|nr:ATP-binding protein [Verrucomicrobiota bacterium]